MFKVICWGKEYPVLKVQPIIDRNIGSGKLEIIRTEFLIPALYPESVSFGDGVQFIWVNANDCTILL